MKYSEKHYPQLYLVVPLEPCINQHNYSFLYFKNYKWHIVLFLRRIAKRFAKMSLFVFSSIALLLYINPFFSQIFPSFCIVPFCHFFLPYYPLYFILFAVYLGHNRTETDLWGYLSTHPPAFQYFYTGGTNT